MVARPTPEELLIESLVDSLPFLNYLPGFLAPWKAEGEKIFQFQHRLFTRHFKDVQKDVKEGKDAHCFTRYALESRNEHHMTDDEIAFLGGVMVGTFALLGITTTNRKVWLSTAPVRIPRRMELAPFSSPWSFIPKW